MLFLIFGLILFLFSSVKLGLLSCKVVCNRCEGCFIVIERILDKKKRLS